MNTFTIKDLENLSGIKAHTIRIWEQRYHLLNPQRTKTNIRSYTNVELKAILNIALLNKYGYKISRIDKMTPEEMNQKIALLSQAEALQEKLINDLIGAMIDMNTDQFEMLLDDHIRAKGIEKVILRTIFPFLEKVGILWVTNHVNPAQEHLATNIIRQKLIMGIEGIRNVPETKHQVLLFLPEGEYHEVGLLFVYYLLKSRGYKVFYLGANVPLRDVEFTANAKQVATIYTHLTSVAHSFNFEKFLINAHNRMPDRHIMISGLLAQQYTKKVPPSIHIKKSLGEVMDSFQISRLMD
ncbi:MAG: MerR family transcriptional regulator [Sediminibacterium sp.]|nr:MerR family transcriptional regulator [Sediminibacterium sp.]